MSTRSNIVIKKGEKTELLYHHHDGYPSGVGAGLNMYINQILESNDADKILETPKKLANYLASIEDDEYEYEKYLVDRIHADIEYLYIINLDDRTITCFSVHLWDYDGNDEFLIDDKNEIENFKKTIFTINFGCTDDISKYD